MYRLLAVDVDGTVLSSSHELSPRVRAALCLARARGLHVALATGKLLRSARTLVQALELTGPQITCNGAVLSRAPDGKVNAFWPLEQVDHALAALRATDTDLGIAWYTPDAIYTDSTSGTLDTVLHAYHESPLHHVARLDHRLPPPAKLLITGSPAQLRAVRQSVTPQLDGQVQVIATTADFLEFLSPLATKGNALREVMRELQIAPAEVIAIGDGENDASMLDVAGCAIAMGNAVPHLLAHATHLTASNDDDGVALAVEALLAGHAPGEPLATGALNGARRVGRRRGGNS